MVNKVNKRKKISQRQYKKQRLLNFKSSPGVRKVCEDAPDTSDGAPVQLLTVSPTFYGPPEKVFENAPETSDSALVELQTVSPTFYDIPDNIADTHETAISPAPKISNCIPVEIRSESSSFLDTPEIVFEIDGTVGQKICDGVSTELGSQATLSFDSSVIVLDTDAAVLPEAQKISNDVSIDLQSKASTSFVATENLPYQVEPEIEVTQKTITGRRILDPIYVFKQLQEQKHNPLFQCDFSCVVLKTEKRIGLISHFNFECKMCKKTFKVCTDDPNNVDRLNVNSAAVTGIVASGIGYSQFEETFAAMDVPIFGQKFYGQIQDQIFNEWEATAVETMEQAAAREKESAIREGKVFNGIPVIDVYADGAWCKRSYGNNYKAMSGVAAIVGRKYGEVLFIGVKNKYCLICAKAQKRQEAPKDHVCYKNYEGSSSGMEAVIICEGFKESINMYGIIYGNIVADGDSATYAKILAANPYAGYVVSKIECRNHVLRNMCNKLRALGKDTKYPNELRKYITDHKIMSIRKVITTSIKHNKHMPKDDAVKNIHQDVTNSLKHAYDDHTHCKDYCCNKDKNILSPTVTKIENSTFWFRLKVIINTVAAKSRSLSEDVDTNSVERFNSIVAKFVGGKRVNFASRRSYQARCSAAVVSFNTQRPLYTIHKKMLAKSPRGSLKRLESKRAQKRRQANVMKRKKNRSKLFEKQNDYGAQVEAPDMSADEFKVASADFMRNLHTLVQDREGIQKRTTQQRESAEWLQIRRLMITASNFGSIVKRQKNFGNLVNNILYKSNISSIASVAHGINNEKFALQQLSKKENIQIEDCGLFVDEEFPYIGATPDGIVQGDTIVEVKCPVAAFKIGLENAKIQNKIQILRYKNGRTTINKNSNWFYQVQGQLRVTKKKRCIFGIWAGEDKDMEVLYIQRDDDFWKKNMEPKLVNFYYTHILPELVDSRKSRGMPLRGCQK